MTVLEKVDLKPYNTFGISVIAKYFVAVRSVQELRALLIHPIFLENPVLLLGGGSNVLLRSDFDGLVVHLATKGIEVLEETDTQILLAVQAGEVWHDLVWYCTENNWGGLENLALIPGSVGAAPMQNIGAYGVEVKDCFHSLLALNRETGEVETFSKDECKFGYRDSVFKQSAKDKYVIVEVRFMLAKFPDDLNTSYGAILDELNGEEPTVQSVRDAVIRIRRSKLPDPKKIGNSGSFFKNPVVSKTFFTNLQQNHPEIAHYPLPEGSVKLAAGWLIEQAGFKGLRLESDAGVHEKQALVLVNYGQASGADIFALSNQIIQKVHDVFGVQLEREVNMV